MLSSRELARFSTRVLDAGVEVDRREVEAQMFGDDRADLLVDLSALHAASSGLRVAHDTGGAFGASTRERAL